MQMAAVYSGSIAPGMMPGMVPGMVPGMPYGVPGMVSLYDEVGIELFSSAHPTCES